MKVAKHLSFVCVILLGAVLLNFGLQRSAAFAQRGEEGKGLKGSEQFFELRIYTAAPGKLEALHKRFRDHAVPMFEKHGIKSVGYWTAVDDEHKGKLYYIIAYPDRESRERMLINGIAKDPAFLKAVAESEKDGKLTEGVESVLMVPTDYSPIR